MIVLSYQFAVLMLAVPAGVFAYVTEQNVRCIPSANSPQPMLSKQQALLQSRCFTACLQMVKKEMPRAKDSLELLKGNCSRIQAVDECRVGCVKGSHVHGNKTSKTKQCAKKCSSVCKKIRIKWAKHFGMTSCHEPCQVSNCVSGCLIKLTHHPVTILRNHKMPTPVIYRINNSALYSVKGLASFKGVWHKNVLHHSALLFKVNNYSNTSHFYYWLPKLDIDLDLGYFACQVINVSLMAVNGNKTTHFSPSKIVKLSECQTRPAGFHKLLYRLTQIEAKLDKLLVAFGSNPSQGKKIGQKLDDLEAKVHKIIKKLSGKH